MICTFCKKSFLRPYRISARRAANPQYCSPQCVGRDQSEKRLAPFADKFWARVKPANHSGCREWNGSRTYKRYGLIDSGGRPELAHRIAYRLSIGIDPGKMSVCHRCDNPPCCEPSHLWLGTHKENMQDMAKKGRANPPIFRGEDSPRAKLSLEDVASIRSDRRNASAIARERGVTRQCIRNIQLRKSWAHA